MAPPFPSSALLPALPPVDENLDLFPGFSTHEIPIPAPPTDTTLDLTLHCRRYVPAAPQTATRVVVLLHGHPQTHHIWHRVVRLFHADEETRSWELIIPDLRGYGKSSKPPVAIEMGAPQDGSGKHRMTKREMARDIVELAKYFGHDKFNVLSHDRGARVAHRLALDHPEHLQALILLDIAPTLDMYSRADKDFAKVYVHWFLLLQSYPIPEQMILNSPSSYLELLVTRYMTPSSHTAQKNPDGSSEPLHPPALLAIYLAQLSSPLAVHATVEDYRASGPGGPDLLLDEQDHAAGRRITCPTAVLWGLRGVVQRSYGGGEEVWKSRLADGVHFRACAVDSGHYIPEENPVEVVREAKALFGRD